MPNLFEIGDDLREADELLEQAFEQAGEEGLSQDDPVLRWFEAIKGQEATKLEGYGWLLRELNVDLAGFKQLRDEFVRKAQVTERKIAWLKQRLLEYMTDTDQTRIKTPSFTVSRRANGGKAPVVFEKDELPEEFLEQVLHMEVRTNDLRDALEAGQQVQGAYLGARGQHVQVR